jgi:hypothetical protein
LARNRSSITELWIVFGDCQTKSDLFIAYLIEEWGILEDDWEESEEE